MRKIIGLILFFLLFANITGAEVLTFSSAATAAEYLSIPAGARPTGLGNAFTAVLGDINTLFWNPAGLAGLTGRRVMLAHNAWIEGIHLEYLLYAQPVGRRGVIGGGLNYINFGAIERWSIDGSGNPVPLEGSYTPYALSGVLAYALRVGGGFYAGAGLKLAYDQIDNSGSLAGAVDAGLVYQAGPGWTAGLVLKNLGVAAENSLLPMSLRMGTVYDLPYSISSRDTFALLADLEIKYDERPVAGVGIEYAYLDLFQIRLGWNQNFGQADPNRLGITAGAGVAYAGWGLDYSLAPQGDLGLSHKVSVEYGF